MSFEAASDAAEPISLGRSRRGSRLGRCRQPTS
jgi:hypothetical protein